MSKVRRFVPYFWTLPFRMSCRLHKKSSWQRSQAQSGTCRQHRARVAGLQHSRLPWDRQAGFIGRRHLLTSERRHRMQKSRRRMTFSTSTFLSHHLISPNLAQSTSKTWCGPWANTRGCKNLAFKTILWASQSRSKSCQNNLTSKYTWTVSNSIS